MQTSGASERASYRHELLQQENHGIASLYELSYAALDRLGMGVTVSTYLAQLMDIEAFGTGVLQQTKVTPSVAF